MAHRNLRPLLQHHLPHERQAVLARIGALAAERGWPVYLVGGPVRDVLLGLAPHDVDVVVEGPAPKLAQALAQAVGGEVVTHSPFGTATWVGPEALAVDFASARTETYAHPAALPTVAFPKTLADDLRRRDFTINAMAVRLDGDHWGDFLDPFNGQADLAAGVVRVLHPASFQDDPTRLFRAVRYEQRLGAHLAPETEALFAGAWAALAALTPERTRHEFEMIFREARASAMLHRLHGLGVLAHVHSALQWSAAASQRADIISTLPLTEWKLNAPFEPEAAYLALLLMTASAADVEDVLVRLNPNRAVSLAVKQAQTLRPTWTRPSEAVAVLDSVSELGVIAAYVVQRHPDFSTYLAHWRFVRPTTTGADLLARGLPPGPRFKEILWHLRVAWLDGNVQSEADEHAWLEQLLQR